MKTTLILAGLLLAGCAGTGTSNSGNASLMSALLNSQGTPNVPRATTPVQQTVFCYFDGSLWTCN